MRQERTMKTTLVYSVAVERKQNIVFNIRWELCTGQLRFSPLRMSANDHKSATSTDFGLTNKFQSLGTFSIRNLQVMTIDRISRGQFPGLPLAYFSGSETQLCVFFLTPFFDYQGCPVQMSKRRPFLWVDADPLAHVRMHSLASGTRAGPQLWFTCLPRCHCTGHNLLRTHDRPYGSYTFWTFCLLFS